MQELRSQLDKVKHQILQAALSGKSPEELILEYRKVEANILRKKQVKATNFYMVLDKTYKVPYTKPYRKIKERKYEPC